MEFLFCLLFLLERRANMEGFVWAVVTLGLTAFESCGITRQRE